MPPVDPMTRVMEIGPRINVAVASVLAAVAITLHAGAAAGATTAALFSEIGAWNRDLRSSLNARLAQMYEVDVTKEAPPPPVPEEPKEEPKPLPKENAPPP